MALFSKFEPQIFRPSQPLRLNARLFQRREFATPGSFS